MNNRPVVVRGRDYVDDHPETPDVTRYSRFAARSSAEAVIPFLNAA